MNFNTHLIRVIARSLPEHIQEIQASLSYPAGSESFVSHAHLRRVSLVGYHSPPNYSGDAFSVQSSLFPVYLFLVHFSFIFVDVSFSVVRLLLFNSSLSL